MVVGVLEITLRLEGNQSLKEKRKVVKSILARVKARFNVGASEVGAQNTHQLSILGFCAVGPDFALINSVLDHVLDFVEDHVQAEVVDSQLELEHFFN